MAVSRQWRGMHAKCPNLLIALERDMRIVSRSSGLVLLTHLCKSQNVTKNIACTAQ
jgi:hypothetical protein